jgi:hypothetical protein
MMPSLNLLTGNPAKMPPPTSFRVVAVRPDGTRHVLCVRLTWDRAEYVQRALAKIVAFREVLVEPEEQPVEVEEQSDCGL